MPERSADDLWRDLCDKDDRTSPAEYPDMALITQDEFTYCLDAFTAAARRAAFNEARAWHEQEYVEFRKLAETAAGREGGYPRAEALMWAHRMSAYHFRELSGKPPLVLAADTAPRPSQPEPSHSAQEAADAVFICTNDTDTRKNIAAALDTYAVRVRLITFADAQRAALVAKLPQRYQWGHDAMEQFNFGKLRAAGAIHDSIVLDELGLEETKASAPFADAVKFLRNEAARYAAKQWATVSGEYTKAADLLETTMARKHQEMIEK